MEEQRLRPPAPSEGAPALPSSVPDLLEVLEGLEGEADCSFAVFSAAQPCPPPPGAMGPRGTAFGCGGGLVASLEIPSCKPVGDLSVEVAALCQEVADHNARLLKMVQERLKGLFTGCFIESPDAMSPVNSAAPGKPDKPDRLDGRHSIATTGPRRFSQASMTDGRTVRVPDRLRLIMPLDLRDCGGVYTLSERVVIRDMPTWKQLGGPHVLLYTQSGRWAVGLNIQATADAHLGVVRCTTEMATGGLPEKTMLQWEAVEEESEEAEVCSKAIAGVLAETLGSTVKWVGGTSSCRSQHPKQLTRIPAPAGGGLKKAMSGFMRSPTMRASPPQVTKGRLRLEGSQVTATSTSHTFGRTETGILSHTRVCFEGPQEEIRRNSGWGIAKRLRATTVDRAKTVMGPKACVFQNVDNMKESMMRRLMDESQVFNKAGILHDIVKSSLFEMLTLAVIVANAIWIGYDAQTNKMPLPQAPYFHQVMEHVFCMFFTVEVAGRYLLYVRSVQAFTDSAFVFDLILVLLMEIETWLVYAIPLQTSSVGGLSVLRLLRLSRMGRMVRLVRAVPELMLIIKGVSVASRSVFWTLALMLVVIYVFAVAFYILGDGLEIGQVYFQTVPDSMAFLLLPGLLPDNYPYMKRLRQENMAFAVLFLVFIVVGAITIMNMLVGVMVEGVNAVSMLERAAYNLNLVKDEMTVLIRSVLNKDPAGSTDLTRDDMNQILASDQCVITFSKIGVDIAGLAEILDHQLFKFGTATTFQQLLDLVLQLRGSNSATVRDVVALRTFIVDELHNFAGMISCKNANDEPDYVLSSSGLVLSSASQENRRRSDGAMSPTNSKDYCPGEMQPREVDLATTVGSAKHLLAVCRHSELVGLRRLLDGTWEGSMDDGQLGKFQVVSDDEELGENEELV